MKSPLLLLLLPALGCSADRDDPQKLFHRMERALLKAETIQMTATTGEDRTTFKFDPASHQLRYERSRPGWSCRIVSDGQRIQSSTFQAPFTNADPGAAVTSEIVIHEFLRGGLPAIERGRWASGNVARTDPPLTGFKLLRHERQGFRSTAVVQVTGWRPMTFWIDERSGLPRKAERTHSGKCGDEFMVVETYGEILLDERIPAEQFEVEFTLDTAPSSGPGRGRP